MQMLRAAFEKLQLAENLVDRMLAYSASVEQTEQLTAMRSELRAILLLILIRLEPKEIADESAWPRG
jgi:hypothetical protein